MVDIKDRYTGVVIFSTEASSIKRAVELTVNKKVNLQRADLWEADLRGANLRRANLWRADLWGANLRRADLWGADLRGADLRGANLRGADLREADLDFASWHFSCKTFDVKAGDRLVAQLFCHWSRLDVSGCSPHIRYMHRFIVNLFGKSMTNWFCKFRNDVDKI